MSHLWPSSRIVELIYTTAGKGKGTEQDPYRTVHTFHNKDGKTVMVYDPCGVVETATNKPKEVKLIYEENLNFK